MGKIFSILLALALVLSVGLVTGIPVQASVSQPEVTVSTVLAGSVAEYTIMFDINSSLLSLGDSITVDFPLVTTVPGTGNYSNGDIRINGANVTGGDVIVVDRKVTMQTPIDIGAPATVTVVFTTNAGIINPPSTGDYTLKVNTSGTYDKTPVVSEEYPIRELPTVTAVSPGRGNVDDTMWVVITGTSFMGNEDTNASNTAISFGLGASIDVIQTKYISVNEINAQIEVNGVATFTVSAETPAGNSNLNGTFNANADGTPQVDVWEKYTPSDEIFDVNTLVFRGANTTISGAISAAVAGDTLIVHAATYNGFEITKDNLTIQGPTDAVVSGAAPGWDAVVYIRSGVSSVTIQGLTIDATGVTNGIEATESGTYSSIAILGSTINNFNKTGILVKYADAVQLEDNNISTTDHSAAPNGIQIGYVGATTGTTGTVNDNQISGCHWDGYDPLTETYEDDWTGSGILVIDTNSELEISDNEVQGCGVGMDIESGTPTTIMGNDVHGNSYGVVFWNAATPINYNDIYDNVNAGVYRAADGNLTGTLNALYNWWGHAIGPHHDTLNPGGQLSAVTGNVSFSPWLYKPLEQFAHDAPCLAGSVVLANEAEEIEPGSYAGGWNSFSTPVTLDSSADYVSEVLALVAESDLSILRAQRFNLATQQWVLVIVNDIVVENYEIQPGEGFYIQVQSKGSLPILVEDTITQPPMRNLVAGWNLIGMSSLGEQNVATALSGVEYSMVLSPKPPNDVAWSVPPSVASVTFLQLGKAYWVAMGESGILFGSTYTPVASDMTWDLNQ